MSIVGNKDESTTEGKPMDFTEIKDGECVPGNGVYRMSMEHYHTQSVCPGPSISSTGIRKAYSSPHAFWKTSQMNPDKYPDPPENASFTLGKAAHAIVLGDEVFDEKFIYIPKDSPQRPTATQVAAFDKSGEWSENAAPRAKFWEAFDKKATGRLLLKQEQVEKIYYMAENIAASPEAVEVLTSEFIELSMIWEDEVTGLWLKARPDNLPTNGVDFGDLKTFAPKINSLGLAVQRAITDFSYHMQMALAIMGAEHTLGVSAKRAALVFVQTSAPYEVVPVEIDPDTLYWGSMQCRKGINAIAHGLKTGEWPGQITGFLKYSLPPFELDRLAEAQREGTLPNE